MISGRDRLLAGLSALQPLAVVEVATSADVLLLGLLAALVVEL